MFFVGDYPDSHLTAPITSPREIHVWDLHVGAEAFPAPVPHDGIREDLRRQAEAHAAKGLGASLNSAAGEWDVKDDDSVLTMGVEGTVMTFWEGVGNVKWSPDGNQLAFIGALDGPSGDVYGLDVDDWRVTRGIGTSILRSAAYDQASRVSAVGARPDAGPERPRWPPPARHLTPPRHRCRPSWPRRPS